MLQNEKTDVRKIPVQFKIYANFESVESCKGSYLKNIKVRILVVLLGSMFVRHNVLMTAYDLNVKGVSFSCISRDEAVSRLDNSVLDDKSLL